MTVECVFCRAEKAIELNPEMPLCLRCAEVRDFFREYKATKDTHNMSVDEYVQDMLRFYSPSACPSASVN